MWLALLLLFSAAAQDRVKPLDPEKGRTKYSFPIVPGGKPFRFQVQLDKEGNVTGVDVFREGDTAPFQSCPHVRTRSRRGSRSTMTSGSYLNMMT